MEYCLGIRAWAEAMAANIVATGMRKRMEFSVSNGNRTKKKRTACLSNPPGYYEKTIKLFAVVRLPGLASYGHLRDE